MANENNNPFNLPQFNGKEAAMAGNVDEWDNLEIEAIHDDGEGNCHPVHSSDDLPISYWSVYAHRTAGGVYCIADVATEEEAVALHDLIIHLVKTIAKVNYLDK